MACAILHCKTSKTFKQGHLGCMNQDPSFKDKGSSHVAIWGPGGIGRLYTGDYSTEINYSKLSDAEASGSADRLSLELASAGA